MAAFMAENTKAFSDIHKLFKRGLHIWDGSGVPSPSRHALVTSPHLCFLVGFASALIAYHTDLYFYDVISYGGLYTLWPNFFPLTDIHSLIVVNRLWLTP